MKDTPRDGVTVYDDARFFKKFYIFHVIKMTNWAVFIRLKKNLLQRLYKRPSCIVG